MPKIIRNYAGTITIGKDDGTVWEIPKSAFDFEPVLGDTVDVYQNGSTYIVVKSMTTGTSGGNGNNQNDAYRNRQQGGIRCPSCGSCDVENNTIRDQKTTSYSDNGCDYGSFLLKRLLNPFAWRRFSQCICFLLYNLQSADVGPSTNGNNSNRDDTTEICTPCDNRWDL